MEVCPSNPPPSFTIIDKFLVDANGGKAGPGGASGPGGKGGDGGKFDLSLPPIPVRRRARDLFVRDANGDSVYAREESSGRLSVRAAKAAVAAPKGGAAPAVKGGAASSAGGSQKINAAGGKSPVNILDDGTH